MPDKLEREYLLSTKPDIYYLTPHYENFECLLVRIPLVEPDELRELFEAAWLTYAPKRLAATYQTNGQS